MAQMTVICRLGLIPGPPCCISCKYTTYDMQQNLVSENMQGKKSPRAQITCLASFGPIFVVTTIFVMYFIDIQLIYE